MTRRTPPLLTDICAFALILLCVYAGSIKLLEVGTFQIQMRKSPLLPASLIPFLSYALPIGELLTALLLVWTRTRLTGFLLSFGIMLLFSLYLTGLYYFFPADEIPCSCGGILGKMSYPVHIVFNLLYTAIALLGCWLQVAANGIRSAIRRMA